MSEEPNQNPKGGPGEKNKSSEIQGREASIKVVGPKTKDKKKSAKPHE